MGCSGSVSGNLASTRRVSGFLEPIVRDELKQRLRRFPVVSGMRVSWDSRREPGQRVLGVWLSKEVEDSVHDGSSGRSTPRLVDAFPIERVEGGRKYSVVTREYMAQGHDGFLPLKRNRYLVDDEVGQVMSTLVRKYLLGMGRVEL